MKTLAATRAAQTREAAGQLGAAGSKVVDAAAAAQPNMPRFALRELAADATVDSQKAWLTDEHIDKLQRRALVVVLPAPWSAVAAGSIPMNSIRRATCRRMPRPSCTAPYARR